MGGLGLGTRILNPEGARLARGAVIADQQREARRQRSVHAAHGRICCHQHVRQRRRRACPRAAVSARA